MLGRRLLLIVAILMGVSALTAGLAAPPSKREDLQAPTPRTGPAVDSSLVERELDASARRASTVVVNQGDTLQLTVSASTLDAVEIEGLDQLEAVTPTAPAIFDVLADRPGTYPIVLLQAGRRVGALRVTPAQE